MDKRLVKTALFSIVMLCAIADAFAQPPTVPAPSTPPSGSAPPPPLASSPTTPAPTPPTTTVQAPQEQLSAAQFQQWLQSNGYGQTQTTVTTTTVSKRPSSRRRVLHPLTWEEGKQIMMNSAPPATQPVSPDSITAFNTLLQQNMPLSPQQVVQLRQQIDTSQRAAAVPANIPPKPVSTTIMINLAPGTTPPAIRLAQGYVSSLVFVDSTGAPWPIAAFDIGNPKAVNLQWDGKSNIIFIQAVSPYSDGNMVFRLVGMPTPITLELVAGQRVVDYRVDLHVSGIGPNAKELPLGTGLPDNPNQLLLSVLDGIAPEGSRALIVHGADAQAWLLGEKIFFRTRLTVLSPGWIGTMSSPDGMMAYELPKTSSILVSRYGEPVELKLEGF